MQTSSRTVGTKEVSAIRDGELYSYEDAMRVRLSRQSDRPDQSTKARSGEEWITFHFQLRGSAFYSVAGQTARIIEDASFIWTFSERDAAEIRPIGTKQGFAVTIFCRTQALLDRLGMKRAELPAAVAHYFENKNCGPVVEFGKLTPGMIMSLRAIDLMPFGGTTRSVYVEARSIGLICDLLTLATRPAAALDFALDQDTLIQVIRTCEHIDTHFAEPLAMRALALGVGTNESKLSKAFSRVVGSTVFEYVRSCRMEAARRLLRNGGLSIAEIAFKVGYTHSCNFSVAYKRHFGLSPKEELPTKRHEVQRPTDPISLPGYPLLEKSQSGRMGIQSLGGG